MKRVLLIVGAALLVSATPAFAHRIDEYLQATTMQVSRERLRMDMRLVPGIAVVSSVVDSIDTNRDGSISSAEAQQYGQSVLNDLALTLDGTRVPLTLVSSHFGTVEEMKRGMGEINLAFSANLPEGGDKRHIVFENHHRSAIAAYLVNGLVPEEQGVRITKQTRNYLQSVYEMDFETGPTSGHSVAFGSVIKWAVLSLAIAIIVGDRVAALRRRRAHAGVTPASR